MLAVLRMLRLSSITVHDSFFHLVYIERHDLITGQAVLVRLKKMAPVGINTIQQKWSCHRSRQTQNKSCLQDSAFPKHHIILAVAH